MGNSDECPGATEVRLVIPAHPLALDANRSSMSASTRLDPLLPCRREPEVAVGVHYPTVRHSDPNRFCFTACGPGIGPANGA